MSHLLLVCTRNPQSRLLTNDTVSQLSHQIMPSNIRVNPPVLIDSENVQCVVFNPVSPVKIAAQSVILGKILAGVSDWSSVGASIPEGSFALFRWNQESVELITDIFASRTVWYVRTPDLFAASTSQRAIAHVLGSFEPNDVATKWMLSSDTLGIGNAWDRRVLPLQGDACLRFDTKCWKTELTAKPVEFKSRDMSEPEGIDLLKNALDTTFSRYSPDLEKWTLLLSGGYDSRLILLHLRSTADLHAVTWADKAKIGSKHGDVVIAGELAKKYGINHDPLVIAAPQLSTEKMLVQFIEVGEGTAARPSGYLDGFAIWKTLFEDGTEGVIRGDVPFGWKNLAETNVRESIGLLTLSDYACYPTLQRLGLESQLLPDESRRFDGESVEQWRDRLKHQFRLPVLMSALNNLKAAYVEVSNPLLSKPIVDVVRQLPDYLRTEKQLTKSLVRQLEPDTRMARRSGIVARRQLFHQKNMVEIMKKELEIASERYLFPTVFCQYLSATMTVNSPWQSPASDFLKRANRKIRRSQRQPEHVPELDANMLAFRAFIVSRTHRLLSQDAARGRTIFNTSDPMLEYL